MWLMKPVDSSCVQRNVCFSRHRTKRVPRRCLSFRCSHSFVLVVNASTAGCGCCCSSICLQQACEKVECFAERAEGGGRVLGSHIIRTGFIHSTYGNMSICWCELQHTNFTGHVYSRSGPTLSDFLCGGGPWVFILLWMVSSCVHYYCCTAAQGSRWFFFNNPPIVSILRSRGEES